MSQFERIFVKYNYAIEIYSTNSYKKMTLDDNNYDIYGISNVSCIYFAIQKVRDSFKTQSKTFQFD